MLRYLKAFRLYLPNRFFVLCTAGVGLFVLAFFYQKMYRIAELYLLALAALFVVDVLLLFIVAEPFSAIRNTPQVMSLGDENRIGILLRNNTPVPWAVQVIDELPVQLQIRDHGMSEHFGMRKQKELPYTIRPLSRGEYHFGNLNVFIRSYLGLAQRRQVIGIPQMVPVYPSILQMKKYELFTFTRISRQSGLKKMRRIGHSYEFEQIKDYVRGDDIRSINWKATGRRSSLMVNQYEDEKSQPVYSVIDKSRIMRMPFNGLSLMDYAINTSLVISNVALKKSDKAGLITFSDKIGNAIRADRSPGQLRHIMNALYNQKERQTEADYELLYQAVNRVVKQRSLVFLYTNFESIYGLERVLPILRRINKSHLLVVMFFENTELSDFAYEPAADVRGIYTRTVAQQFLQDKRGIAQTLANYGIQAVLSKPEDLSMNSINKYLELKARGLI